MATTIHLFPSDMMQPHLMKPRLHVATSAKAISRPFPQRSSSLEGNHATTLHGLALQVIPHANETVHVRPTGKHVKYLYRHDSHNDIHAAGHSLSPVLDASPLEIGLAKTTDTPQTQTPPRRHLSTRGSPGNSSLRQKNVHRRSSVYSQASQPSSPTLVRSNSGTSHETPVQNLPMRSMFPQYQHDVPFSQQQYTPPQSITTSPPLPSQQISKGLDCAPSFALPVDPARLSSAPSARQLLPIADDSELLKVYEAANGEQMCLPPNATTRFAFSCAATQVPGAKRKGLHMSIASSSGSNLYSASVPARTVDTPDSLVELDVQRCHPSEGGTFPVSQMVCQVMGQTPRLDGSPGCMQQTITAVFPQIAALSAIRDIANSLQARSIAQFDPNASSPQAAQLAFDAVANAKAQDECRLDYVSRGPASYYELLHPVSGTFSIIPTGTINLFDTQSTGKIIVSTSDSTTIAALDLATQSLDLNLATLQNLDSPFIIDTIVSTLLSVAITQSFRSAETAFTSYFAAPPKSALASSRKASRSSSPLVRTPSTSSSMKSRLSFRSSKSKTKKSKEKEVESGKVQLPTLTRGFLHLLGFSFDAIVWVLGLGVKILTKLVMLVTGIAQRA